MKITKSKLRKIITEELAHVMQEEMAMTYPQFVTLVKGINDPDEPAFMQLPKTFEALVPDAVELYKIFDTAHRTKHRDKGAGVEKVNQEVLQFINRASGDVGYLMQKTAAILDKPAEDIGKFMAFAPGVGQRLKVIMAALKEINDDFTQAEQSAAKDGAQRALLWLSNNGPAPLKIGDKMVERLTESKALQRIVQAAQDIAGSMDQFGEQAEQPAAEV